MTNRTRECPICGVSFEPVYKTVRYCSDECRKFASAKSHRASRERLRKGRTCKRCGASLQGKPNRQVYCSDECKRGTRICEKCGKEFVPTRKSAGRFCSTECFYELLVPTGTVNEYGGGYTITKVPPGTPGGKMYGCRSGRWMLTHRYVMQQKLGRTLEKYERVHHINGDRGDNRPENLELWQHSHPSGVRKIDDLMDAFAKLTAGEREAFRQWVMMQEEQE